MSCSVSFFGCFNCFNCYDDIFKLWTGSGWDGSKNLVSGRDRSGLDFFGRFPGFSEIFWDCKILFSLLNFAVFIHYNVLLGTRYSNA